MRSWNDATSEEIELAILIMISAMPDTYIWHECRLYACEFVSEGSLLPLVLADANSTGVVTNGGCGGDSSDSTDEEDDPYLPKSVPATQQPAPTPSYSVKDRSQNQNRHSKVGEQDTDRHRRERVRKEAAAAAVPAAAPAQEENDDDDDDIEVIVIN